MRPPGVFPGQPRREQPAALAVKADMRLLPWPLPMSTVTGRASAFPEGLLGQEVQQLQASPGVPVSQAHSCS